MDAFLLEEMAWSLARIVARAGVCLEEYAERELTRLVPRVQDRAACHTVALTKGWIAFEEYGAVAYGRNYYVAGDAFHPEKKRRYEAATGKHIREDWDE